MSKHNNYVIVYSEKFYTFPVKIFKDIHILCSYSLMHKATDIHVYIALLIT